MSSSGASRASITLGATFTSSGLAGPAETTTIGGLVQLTRAAPGLIIGGGPRCTTQTSGGAGLDVTVWNVRLQGSYQFAPWLAVVGGYNFFQQRSTGSQVAAASVDQNRVFFGLQFGYPLGFQ